jgi:phosphopantetheinyl transferase
LDYNISHEGDWVILAAIKEKDKMIGVDTVVIDRSIGSIDSFVKSFESQVNYYNFK